MSVFIDALDFADLCEDRLSQFVSEQTTHRPGTVQSAVASL